jgi:polyisoprenoid-binding protein YceI
MTVLTQNTPGYIAGTWKIDPFHSEVSFVVRHLMVSKVRGRFDAFEGEIVTGEDLTSSAAMATIDVASINTGNQTRDDHVRSADFFDAENHPTIQFVSRELIATSDGFSLNGDLTIRGVTKPVLLQVELNGFGPDAYGGTRVGFSATGTLDRTDFGVSYNGPIPGGGSVLANTVTISLEVEAVLQA